MDPAPVSICIRAIRGFIGFGILSLVAVAALSAQSPQHREGFWVRLGAGYGSSHRSCDSCPTEPQRRGVIASVAAGGTLGPAIRVGGTLDSWIRRSNGATETMANLVASVFYYPFVSTGLFVTGGLGVSSYRANTAPAVTGTGWGLMLGVGYDLPVSRHLSLTPVATYIHDGIGDVSITDGGGTFATGWKQNVFHVEVGVTFHR
jgi:hypothetical protein